MKLLTSSPLRKDWQVWSINSSQRMPWKKSGAITQHIPIPSHKTSLFISIPLIKLSILKVRTSMPRDAQFLSMQWTKKPVTLSKLRDSKMAQRHIKGKRILKSIHSPMRLSLRSRQLSILEMKILAQLIINLSRTISIISRTSGTTSKSREILLSRSCISLLFSWLELLD